MTLDPTTCYPALRARDARFDGTFFVGVSTTGIYCRPICPARLPARDRCAFFPSAALAEQAGFRACLRCRPELAPGHASVDARSRLARLATVRIEAGYLDARSVKDLAASLGVTPRHLHRALVAELGIAPLDLAQSRRLALAKRLLNDTRLSVLDVALASGFSSLRRFNDVFRRRFGRTPSSIRRGHAPAAPDDPLELRLDYRPPFDAASLLRFLKGRAIPGVEAVDGDEYRRSVSIDGHVGWVTVTPGPRPHSLLARVAPSLAPRLLDVTARLRALFDLDARPDLVADHLGADPLLAPHVRARPGLRVPGAFDGFELAVRAILGQQVSVRAATTVSGRLVERFGTPVATPLPGITHAFPTPARLADATESGIAAAGLPGARARSILALARVTADGRLDLGLGADPDAALAALLALPGIGPWTGQYVALRALRRPDAFPSGDLVLRRCMGVTTSPAAERRAEAWRPWRAYAALHLWTSLSAPEA